MTPHRLLAGPVGRRLCLELVEPRGLEQPAVRDAWNGVGAATEGVALFFMTDAEGWWARRQAERQARAEMARRRDVATRSMADGSAAAALARAVEGVLAAPDVDLSAPALMFAFRQVMGMAMFYQGPDPTDTVAADAAVVTALEPMADLLQVSDVLASWDAATSHQFLVDFSEHPPQRPEVFAAKATEPVIGPWWSAPVTGSVRTYGDLPGFGPSIMSLEEDDLDWRAAMVTELDPSGDVYVIDSAESWRGLAQRYPLGLGQERSADMSTTWGAWSGWAGGWTVPDWRAVAQEWDAVRMTVSGYLEVAGRAIELSDGSATFAAGWSPGETHWLRVLPPAIGDPVRWVRVEGDRDDHWEPVGA